MSISKKAYAHADSLIRTKLNAAIGIVSTAHTHTHTHFLVVVANGSDNIQFHSIWIGNILLEFLFYSRELLRLFAVHFNSKIPFDSFFSFVELPRYIVTTNYFISSLLNFSRNCCLLQRSQIRSTLEKSLPYD